jgi:hypothetical protein
MKKFEIITSFKLYEFKRNKKSVLDALNSFNGNDFKMILELPKKKRSNNQNRFYWGVLIPLMQLGAKDLWGEVWSIDKAHKHLSSKFVFHESINERTGEITQTPKSTTELTTTGWEVFMTEVRIYLLEDFDIDAPEPNQEMKLEI